MTWHYEATVRAQPVIRAAALLLVAVAAWVLSQVAQAVTLPWTLLDVNRGALAVASILIGFGSAAFWLDVNDWRDQKRGWKPVALDLFGFLASVWYVGSVFLMATR